MPAPPALPRFAPKLNPSAFMVFLKIFIEAFANIYRNFSYSVYNYNKGIKDDPIYDFPTVNDGHRGMKFIDAVIESSKNSTWIKI